MIKSNIVFANQFNQNLLIQIGLFAFARFRVLQLGYKLVGLGNITHVGYLVIGTDQLVGATNTSNLAQSIPII
jgi:hypothetical protein